MSSKLNTLLDWATERNITLHPSVEVKKSDLGGYGLFATDAIEEGAELVRVEKSAAFHIDSLLEYKNFLDEQPDRDTYKKILNAALETGGARFESIIIRSFLWGFAMILRSEHLSVSSDLDHIHPYLDILLETPVLGVNESAVSSDGLVSELIREKQSVKRDYTNLVAALPETKSLLSFDTAFHLHQAVKSRVLDVPEFDPESGTGEYVTNITMVPVLDFTNHCNANNAVFDIDLDSNEDIILRLDKSVASGDEITMRYDTEINVNQFVRTYGFVPEASREITWKVPDWVPLVNKIIDGEEKDYEAVARSFGVSPELRVWEDTTGSVGSDLLEFTYPFLLISGLIYHKEAIEDAMDDLDLSSNKGDSPDDDAPISTHQTENVVDVEDVQSEINFDTKSSIDTLAKYTADMLSSLGSRHSKKSSMPLESGQIDGVRDYENKRDVILDKFFATTYDAMLENARKCICVHILPHMGVDSEDNEKR